MMRLAPLAAVGLVTLSGCAQLGLENPFTGPQTVDAALAAAAPPEVETLDPTPPPPPPASANTAAGFDTTTAEDRAEALAAPEEPVAALGTTLATLGNPAIPGIWIETGLVSELTPGRAEAAGGQSINAELRPSGNAPGSGSEISLPAMQLLGLPLTAIAELTLYRQ